MTKRALCVGINTFAHLPMASWLNGCVNDAADMADMLVGRGFSRDDITILTDQNATKAAVMEALTMLVKEATTGDQVVFTFSSHGTQVPDTNGDEADGADEAFACHDIAANGDQWDPATVIVDDELRLLFDTLAKGVVLEVFLDTCHSGSGLKAEDLLSGRRPKFLPAPTLAGMRALADSSERTTFTEFARTARGAAKPVLFGGCRADQTSADATFDHRPNGAFTYYLLKALQADPTATRSAILKALTTSLRDGEFSQRPTLEGPRAAKKVPLGEPW